MQWSSTERQGCVVASPDGRVDEATAEAFTEHLASSVTLAAESPGRKLIVDFAGLDYMSSRGLARADAGQAPGRCRRCHDGAGAAQRGDAGNSGDQPLRQAVCGHRYDRGRILDLAREAAIVQRRGAWACWSGSGERADRCRSRRPPRSCRTRWRRRLLAASGRSFADIDEARSFARNELDFATSGTFGGATTCVEIEAGDPAAGDALYHLRHGQRAARLRAGCDAPLRAAATRGSITSSCRTCTGTTSWASRSSCPRSIPMHTSSSIRAMPMPKPRCAASRRKSPSRWRSTGCAPKSSSAR